MAEENATPEENKPEGKTLAEEKLEFAKQMLEGAVNGGNPDTIKQYLDAMMMVYDVSAVSNGALIQADLLKGVFAEPQVKEHLETMSKLEGEEAVKANIILKAQEELTAKEKAAAEKAPAEQAKGSGESVDPAQLGLMSPPATIPSASEAQGQGMKQPQGGGRGGK